MARKRELASKLSPQGEEQASRPGWRDAITGPVREELAQPDSEQSRRRTTGRRELEREDAKTRRRPRRQPADLLMRKTYLLTPELVDHIAELAETERVGINELVRFLLRASLDLVETGELEIPTRPARRRIVPEE